jgi:uncharacterized membrane protein
MRFLKRLPRCSEFEMEKMMGNLLRSGVLLSAAVVLIGLGLYVVAPHSASSTYRIFEGEPADLRSVGGILKDAVAMKSRGIIQLGLLLLLATPIARVALSVLAFACQKDKIYVFVTLIVLSVLAYSLTGAIQ